MIDHVKLLFSLGKLSEARALFANLHYQRQLVAGVTEKPMLWDGRARPGASILLTQASRLSGYGDTLMNVRFSSWLSERGMRVFVEARSSIEGLCRTVPGVERVVRRWDDYEAPSYEIDLYSLPMFVDDELSELGRYIPYVKPNETESLELPFLNSAQELKVGLSWEGSKAESENLYTWRSIPVALLRPILDIGGVRCVNLQVGAGRTDLGTLPKGINAVTLDQNMTSFEMTARIVSRLDVVVTIDSSLAHLAGSLGITTFVMLPFNAEWRWLVDGHDSPLYPSIRLFRQRSPGEWSGVIEEICLALRKRLASLRAAGNAGQ